LWWRENKHLYLNIAWTAHKWLCVPATSTPSERVFSNCGVALRPVLTVNQKRKPKQLFVIVFGFFPSNRSTKTQKTKTHFGIFCLSPKNDLVLVEDRKRTKTF
jgi:hypothetical protein